MRKFIFVAGLFLLLGFSAAAQDKRVELFAGYSYARVESVAGDRSNLNDHIAWRIIQGDYLMNRFFSRNNNNVRLASGLVIRF